MKKSALVLVAAAGMGLSAWAAGPAQAMGSGNNYADFQVGVTYTVYQPTYTNGLKQISFNGDAGDASCAAEESFVEDEAQTEPKAKASFALEWDALSLAPKVVVKIGWSVRYKDETEAMVDPLQSKLGLMEEAK